MQEQKKKKIRSRDITHRMIVMNQMHRRMLEVIWKEPGFTEHNIVF